MRRVRPFQRNFVARWAAPPPEFRRGPRAGSDQDLRRRAREYFAMSYAMFLSLVTVAILVGMGVYLFFLVKNKLT
jgi:hypothetical protein